jgi:DNA (cytosine-5)-methyltransferase 1
MSRPKLLDLACCAGGAAMGYYRAGFDVVGWDINPQPRYPFEFHQGDGIEVLRDRAYVQTFDAVHASWPCQGFKKGTLWSNKPDLVTPGRELMLTYDLPWVIENVMEAPLRDPIVLCGSMFLGPTGKPLRVYRHRKFEGSPSLNLVAPPHPKHAVKVANSQRLKRWNEGWNASITGDVGTYVGPEGMDIDWMTGNELSEAIPPAYSEWVGRQMIASLEGVRAA